MKSNFFSKIIDAFWILLIVVLVVVGIFSFLNAFKIFPLNALLDKIFSNEEEVLLPDNQFEKDILKLIELNEPDNDYNYSYISLSHEKVSTLLGNLEATEKYYWEVETISGTDKNKRTQTHRIYKKGDKIRVDTVDAYSDSTTVFSDGITKIKNNKTGVIRQISGDTDFSYDNVINIAALAYIFSDEEQTVDFVGVVENGEEKYLYVETAKRTFSGKDMFFVSIEHGVVLNSTSEIDGETVFSQKTLNFDTVSLISDDTFELVE